VKAFSSNYVLYGDISRRLYEVLQRFSPRVEPYSIDEMFIDLEGLPDDLLKHCQTARVHCIARPSPPGGG
jgi:DNA polymerase V